ncbi:vesicle transport v-SNARE 12 [Olea europaea subsp. europaea]|uniref:Vesicle transport v-SNARE 12 n=1 Tax=Olea europaea subsp. europaea TaxID=158383 RepID=A0A8S0RAQ4_OLEEU|nr:vesicle transport v-SNARE 12 [Olea europaea subsp. europaea]
MKDSTVSCLQICQENATLLLLFPMEKKKQEISELQVALDDADVLIRKMDLEARSLQPSLKATLLAKLREYKSDLNKLKREVKRLASPNSNDPGHEELLESGMAGANSVCLYSIALLIFCPYITYLSIAQRIATDFDNLVSSSLTGENSVMPSCTMSEGFYFTIN